MKFTSTAVWLRCVLFVLSVGLTTALRATTVIPPDFNELVNESDYIIRGVVKSVLSEYRTNSHGKMIFTEVAIDVREVISGTPPTDVVLEILGGRVGEEEMIVQGAPRFKVGEEDILFVKDNGRTIVPLMGMMHGRYPIMEDLATGEKYVARDNKEPLTDTSEIAQPMDGISTTGASIRAAKSARAAALTPAQFSERIKATINPRYVRRP